MFTDLDAYPLPRIDDMINKLSPYKVFSTYDLKSAYHQIPLKESERKYTAFEGLGDLYEFRVLPFGVTNGVSSFQRIINDVITQEDLSDTFPYLDNVTVAGIDQADHDRNDAAFREMIKRRNLTLNESKNVHSVSVIGKFGYRVSHYNIKPDPERLRLNKVLFQRVTYADSVRSEESGVNQSKPTEITDFRTIIKEARNEELAEQTEKRRRACNIILHGVNEAVDADRNEAKKTFINSFIDTIKVATTFKSVLRLGKASPSKNRPIMVVFEKEDEKDKIMNSLKHLKDNEIYKGLSVTEDLTFTDREIIREWKERAKIANDQETAGSKYVYKVRGSPKNGWALKKFLKQRTAIHH